MILSFQVTLKIYLLKLSELAFCFFSWVNFARLVMGSDVASIKLMLIAKQIKCT